MRLVRYQEKYQVGISIRCNTNIHMRNGVGEIQPARARALLSQLPHPSIHPSILDFLGHTHMTFILRGEEVVT